MKSDIQRKADNFELALDIAADGSIVEEQRYFLEPAKKYVVTNFTLTDTPLRVVCEQNGDAALMITAKTANQQEVQVWLNLKHSSPAYYSKQFRKAGLAVKLRRHEKMDKIFKVVEACNSIAEIIYVPAGNGFYRDKEKKWRYAGVDALTWKAVDKKCR